ncbi:hypothetical protein BH23GEM10_BH23GEM10_06910 [soil metagenome]
MVDRIHILVDRAEKQRFRNAAGREGKSLSEWLRGAALERIERSDAGSELDTPKALREFFAACDAREHGPEPDWGTHRAVIERSKTSGVSPQ